MAKPKPINDIDPMPQSDPTISSVAEEVEYLDDLAADSTQPAREVNGFMAAPGVDKMVRHLVNTRRNDLQGERILCMHAAKATKATSPYKVKKIGLMHSAIASYSSLTEEDVFGDGEEFFVILVPFAIWNNVGEKTQEAMIFDALQHIGIDEQAGRRYVKKPDFQGFFETMAAYGLWQEPLKQMAEAAKPHIVQLQLLEN